MTATRSSLDLVVIAFVGLGAIALAGVVLPSPARFGAYSSVQIITVEPNFPTSLPPISADDIAAILEHPLFNADRVKDPEAAPAQLLGLDSYRLTGTIVTEDAGVAFVERVSTKTTVTLKVGGVLDGRVVRSIGPEGVTFAGTGASELLTVPKVIGASITNDKSTTQR